MPLGHTSRVYGSKSTVYEHFQRWNKTGFMTEMLRILLTEYGEKVGIDAQWQAMDGTCGKPRRARKRSAAEGLGRDPTAEGEVAEISISMWMVRGPLWGLR